MSMADGRNVLCIISTETDGVNVTPITTTMDGLSVQDKSKQQKDKRRYLMENQNTVIVVSFSETTDYVEVRPVHQYDHGLT